MTASARQQPTIVYIVALVAAIGGFLFGFDTGIIAGALIFLKQSFQLTTFTQEMVVSSVLLGALIGAALSGWLANFFGRRRMLIIAAYAFIVGTLLTAFAVDIGRVIWGRLIIGLAIGVSSYTVPLFVSEIAPAGIRGSLVLLNAIAIASGEVVAYLVNYTLVPTQSWRWMFAAGLVAGRHVAHRLALCAGHATLDGVARLARTGPDHPAGDSRSRQRWR